MTIREQHYDINTKLNKIDSQQYKSLRVPEKDWALNEAIELFVKIIAEPRTKNQFGFETNQRTIDDIRTIVKDNIELAPVSSGVNFTMFDLPDDYLFYVSSFATASKGNCDNLRMETFVRQHDDRHEISPFDNASFEWRETNIEFVGDQLKTYHDGTFTISKIYLDYIKKPAIVHNAQDFPGGTYNDLDGNPMPGRFVNCDLPEHTHREIVDLAVLILTGEMQIPDIQIKQSKLNLSQI